ncbi:Uncharacterised protein [uncultured archaeon]|nr:Uncharacterised protein [uncultured archaeon]
MRFFAAFAIALVLLFAPSAFAAGSLTLSLNSLDAISSGDSVTLVPTVSASGDTVSNVQVSVSLPSGLTTSGSTTQSIGQMNSGQTDNTKSWNITGNSGGTYTITVTATAQTSTASLTVNSAPYISVTATSLPNTSSTVAIGASTGLSLSFQNTGGATATVTANVTPSSGLTMTSGNAANSFDLNAGQSSSLSWAFQMARTDNQTITVSVAASSGSVSSYTSSYTILGSGSPSPSPSNPGGSTPSESPADTGGAGGGTGGGGPPGEPPGTKCSPVGKKIECTTANKGICAAGTQACKANGTWGECVQDKQARSKNCLNGFYNDCNGKVDSEESACTGKQPGVSPSASPSQSPAGTVPPAETGNGKNLVDMLFGFGVIGAILIIGVIVLAVLGAAYWFFLRKPSSGFGKRR